MSFGILSLNTFLIIIYDDNNGDTVIMKLIIYFKKNFKSIVFISLITQKPL